MLPAPAHYVFAHGFTYAFKADGVVSCGGLPVGSYVVTDASDYQVRDRAGAVVGTFRTKAGAAHALGVKAGITTYSYER